MGVIISKPNNDPRFKLTAFPKKQKLIKIKLLNRNDKRETKFKFVIATADWRNNHDIQLSGIPIKRKEEVTFAET